MSTALDASPAAAEPCTARKQTLSTSSTTAASAVSAPTMAALLPSFRPFFLCVAGLAAPTAGTAAGARRSALWTAADCDFAASDTLLALEMLGSVWNWFLGVLGLEAASSESCDRCDASTCMCVCLRMSASSSEA